MKPVIHINGPKSPDIVTKVMSLVHQMWTVKNILNWFAELGAPAIPGVNIDDDDFVATSVSPNLSSQSTVNESIPASQVPVVVAASETLKGGDSAGEGPEGESTTDDHTDEVFKGCIVCGKKPQAGSVSCSDDFKSLKAGLLAKAKQLPSSGSSSALGSRSSTPLDVTKVPEKPQV